ncbi:PucR family transcriptional regulator [Nocardia vermiculata]|uniref:PucR family transcriptional regulator n=1 Tax=Nocardia vermiculata TaxID=257274 RepID=A0A846Y069_9NOCA|nr:helix-turn-helix domain-containing protein [Nocardia vermiculata]NKY52683.1 PucR family transcriptional regulator [Nocardia vermiculata]
MTVDNSSPTGLMWSGRPISSPLKDVWTLSRHMVGHFVENVAPCGTLPGDAIHGDITTITRTCLELAISLLDGRDIPEKTERLKDAAAGWAREGVPIDTIHHAIHEGFKIGFDLVITNTNSNAQPTHADYADLISGAKLLVEILDTMTTAVSSAYVRELRTVVSEHHNAVHTLTSALLAGHPTSTMARECGIEIADSYHIVALHIPPHPDQANPHLDPTIVARRKLRRIQAALATHTHSTTLHLLSTDGGTLLIPTTRTTTADLDALTTRLSHAARVPITATTTTATAHTIPTATDQTHQLLDMVTRLRTAPGLYRFDDLALEYQLTRPGPGRNHLATLLDPLDHHPELLTTLQTHISNNLNRQRTARHLHVHTNTVDYRLKRIAQLTGLDPTHSTGLWQLRSALIARTYIA